MNPKAIQFPSSTVVKESPDSSEEPEEEIKDQKALVAVPVPVPQDEDYEFMLALDMIVSLFFGAKRHKFGSCHEFIVF